MTSSYIRTRSIYFRHCLSSSSCILFYRISSISSIPKHGKSTTIVKGYHIKIPSIYDHTIGSKYFSFCPSRSRIKYTPHIITSWIISTNYKISLIRSISKIYNSAQGIKSIPFCPKGNSHRSTKSLILINYKNTLIYE